VAGPRGAEATCPAARAPGRRPARRRDGQRARPRDLTPVLTPARPGGRLVNRDPWHGQGQLPRRCSPRPCVAPAGMLPACGLLEQRAGAARCCDDLHGGLGGGLAGVFQVEDVDRRPRQVRNLGSRARSLTTLVTASVNRLCPHVVAAARGPAVPPPAGRSSLRRSRYPWSEEGHQQGRHRIPAAQKRDTRRQTRGYAAPGGRRETGGAGMPAGLRAQPRLPAGVTKWRT